MKTITELIYLKESEDKVEFKEAKGGGVSYNGGSKLQPKDRRRCILGYVVAFANEGGGYLVFGIKEGKPHTVVGTAQNLNSLGDLEASIYRDLGIRTKAYELIDDAQKRVVVVEIPAHPIGKVYRFEDVPLMRVGEELKPMSDQQYLKIIQEQEPDFSQQICPGLTITDLDDEAIQIMKEAYAKKQDNPSFLTLSNLQILSDLELVVNGKITNAAVILLGKENTIKQHIPQAAVHIEYRNEESKIIFDKRDTFTKSFFADANNL